jgi:hypothetical protein
MYETAVKQIMAEKEMAGGTGFQKLRLFWLLLSPHFIHPKYLTLPTGPGPESTKDHCLRQERFKKKE